MREEAKQILLESKAIRRKMEGILGQKIPQKESSDPTSHKEEDNDDDSTNDSGPPSIALTVSDLTDASSDSDWDSDSDDGSKSDSDADSNDGSDADSDADSTFSC